MGTLELKSTTSEELKKDKFPSKNIGEIKNIYAAQQRNTAVVKKAETVNQKKEAAIMLLTLDPDHSEFFTGFDNLNKSGKESVIKNVSRILERFSDFDDLSKGFQDKIKISIQGKINEELILGQKKVSDKKEQGENNKIKLLITSFSEKIAKFEGDKEAALEELLQDYAENEDSAEYKKISRALQKIREITSVIPEEDQEAVSTLLNESSLNLSASKPAEIFAKFSASLEQNKEIKESTKSAIRVKLGIVKTGTDLKGVLSAGQGKDENGEIIIYTKDQPLIVRNGVEVYTDEGNIGGIKVKIAGLNAPVVINSIKKGESIGEIVNAHIITNTFRRAKLGSLLGLNSLERKGGSIDDKIYSPQGRKSISRLADDLLGGINTQQGEILNNKKISRLEQKIKWLTPGGKNKFKSRKGETPSDVFGVNGFNVLINGVIQVEGRNWQKISHFIQSNNQSPSLEGLEKNISLDQALDMDAEINSATKN